MSFGVLPDDVSEVQLDVLIETDMAFLLSDGDTEAFFPKSQIMFHEDEAVEGASAVDFAIPDWLLVKNEFA